MSSTIFDTKKTNPRGIPEAPFIEKVEDFIKNPSDFEMVFGKFQEHLSKYKFMLESKNSTIKQLDTRIPDIENTLKICKTMHATDDDDDSDLEDNDDKKTFEMNYQLNDTLYTRAVANPEKVGLWLGADIMMEYTLEEAIELLTKKLKDVTTSSETAKEDAEYLREQITTMEVNCARLYNWDVEQRSKLDKETKDLKL